MTIVNAHPISCDLLSKLYLCPNSNSTWKHLGYGPTVVICFQNCIFVLTATALINNSYDDTSCDLLSKLYLCPNSNSTNEQLIQMGDVVICFQNCIFVLTATASTY